MKAVTTRGNIKVNDIKIGDIHYEFQYGYKVIVEVISLPERDINGLWEWKSKVLETGEIVNYSTHEDYPQYAPKLYDYEAYITI
jgi:hypothetical protein